MRWRDGWLGELVFDAMVVCLRMGTRLGDDDFGRVLFGKSRAVDVL